MHEEIMNFRKVIEVFLVLAMISFLFSCSTMAGEKGNSSADSLTEGKDRTRLIFFAPELPPDQSLSNPNDDDPARADGALEELGTQINAVGWDFTKENKMRKACGATPFKKQEEFSAAPLALVAFIVEPAINFFVDQINEKLQEELKKYVAVFSGSWEGHFYENVNSIPGPKLQYSCFRLVRLDNLEGQSKIAMDLVGKLEIDPGNEFLKIKPLRLYYFKAKAEEGTPMGISFSIQADSIWRENNLGNKKIIFNESFLSTKITELNRKGVVQYFEDKQSIVPLIPWSASNSTSQKKGGYVKIKIIGSEVGKPPALLKFAANLFSKSKGDIAKGLKKAADELIE